MTDPKLNSPINRVMRFEIQPLQEVRTDIWLNRKHIGLMLAIILMAMLISAVVAAFLPGASFFVVSYSGGEVKQIRTALSFLDALYFTVINMTTVGFGDIAPASATARAIAIFNSIFGLITFAGLVSAITVAFSPKEEPSVGGGVGTLVLTEEAKADLPEPQIHRNFWWRHVLEQIARARLAIHNAAHRDREYTRWARKALLGEQERQEAQADHMEFMRNALREAEERLLHLESVVQSVDQAE